MTATLVLGRVATLTSAAFDELLFVPQAFFSLNELALQLLEIATTDIAQLHALEIIPDALIRVEIRGVARQLFQLQAFGRSSLEKVLDLVSPMNRRAVPDHYNLARDLA